MRDRREQGISPRNYCYTRSYQNSRDISSRKAFADPGCCSGSNGLTGTCSHFLGKVPVRSTYYILTCPLFNPDPMCHVLGEEGMGKGQFLRLHFSFVFLFYLFSFNILKSVLYYSCVEICFILTSLLDLSLCLCI